MNNYTNHHDLSQPSTSGCAKPVHIQRIKQALDLSILQAQNSNPRTVSEDESDLFGLDDNYFDTLNDMFKGENSEDTELTDGMYFNFDELDLERSWLHDIMLEEVNEEDTYDPAEDVNDLMKIRTRQKKMGNHAKPEILEQNMYYGAGILSNFDKYPESKKTIQGKPPKKKREDITLKHPYMTEMFSDLQEDHLDLELENSLNVHNLLAEEPQVKLEHPIKSNYNRKSKTKKFKDEESKKKWEEIMLQKRRKLFSSMIKKEVGKQQRAKMNRHKEALIQTKKMALACQKVARNKALQSARVVKELQWRMKRLSRENLSYWKRSKRADREIRRKLEKEAEEQRKIDFELIEAKRQQRKLNFLITQTELYAHFMSKKLGEASPEEQLRILSQLDEEKNPRLATIDDYDCDKMKAKAIKNAHDAFQYEKARTRQFDITAEMDRKGLDTIDGEFSQPAIFKGTLKAYQLRGMNWLANLYDQGISGILADEMGLGKTVQSIAFLSHLAECQDLWGPFLVICPASTLHNWQQEFAKFVPSFIVVPYWGNPADRKILRQFWHQDGMHTKDAGFHAVITSYQIVITDVKYFNRIKWQYMILDEAQAIKSTSSMRWKTLLGFNCRNRLLLSGTPIQNSMAELWALLHFIMPTLFDSHEEFNEWFSKDIESHAENKTGIDEKHLSRLHMILKPFMLRRIKKDVENELSDKIEIMVYCPLTTRQRLLYMALKQKIHIEDLLHYTVGGGDSHPIDKNFTSNLMNLVMQFRKVCNHPELFERRDAKSPIFISAQLMSIPYLVYDTNVRKEKHMILQKYFLFSKEYISKAITDPHSIFNFCLSLRISTEEIYNVFQGNIMALWKCGFELWGLIKSHFLRINFSENLYKVTMVLGAFMKMAYFIYFDSDLDQIMLTKNNSARRVVYKLSEYTLSSMPETLEHRNIRCKSNLFEFDVTDNFNKNNQDGPANEFPHVPRRPRFINDANIDLPSFLFSGTPKLTAQGPQLYCYSRRAAYDYKRHVDDWSWKSFYYYWSEATNEEYVTKPSKYIRPPTSPIEVVRPVNGWSNIFIPDKETLVTDSGKLSVLDSLLRKLKTEGHRVLIYSQMTKMIDLLEEYMWHRHHKYMRLDGSSKISERRDMVADFQNRNDIFVFLLSTRAGGLGINLTAADTVIFYDSDWNPTVDQQAMDRAHRLGQTKQVTVYRLICKGSIEERILQRAREKSEIQNLVISGGSFKPETLKPKEVVSLLLDDEEIELKYRQRAEERKHLEDMREMDRKRKYAASLKSNQISVVPELKKIKLELNSDGETCLPGESSPRSENSTDVQASDDLSDNNILDVETWDNSGYNLYTTGVNKIRTPPRGSSKRGRPRGSRRASALGRFNNSTTIQNVPASTSATSISEIPISDSLTYGFDNPGNSTILTTQTANSSNSLYCGSTSIRRGPGRPRLKPSGSSNTGSRGTYRPRKPARPLPVPLPSDGSTTSTSYSYFKVHDQPDS